VTFFEEGFSQRKISEKTSIPRSTVQRILRNYLTHNTLMRLKGSGRKKSLNEEDREILKKKVNENGMISAKKLAIEIAKKTKKIISGRTVHNELKNMGFISAIPRKLPLLSSKNIYNRFELCKIWSSWTLKIWNKILFSDETKINLFSSDGRVKVWRKPKSALDNKNILPTTKHGNGGLMIWGCVSYNGVGNLEFIDGIMDKVAYKRILVENLESSREKLGLPSDFIFQQDNDPKHTSKYVKDFFEENGINVLTWPSQSPDLNPIEHLWDYIKREVRKANPKNIKDLKAKVREIWNNVSPDFCRKLINSMPKRVEAVVRAKGKHTEF
jgi:transposase